jgi:signal transduction histidine kinase
MYADLMTELVEGTVKTYAEKLHASIVRSSEFLQNVAIIRRVSEESGHLVPVNLDAVIREEISAFPDASIRYEDPQVTVLADRLLPTVFTNLIVNAVKYGGADVAITIRTEGENDEMLISVEDTGSGIPDEMKEKLLQRFERGKASGRGDGLGLFIVRMLVERYGGESGSKTGYREAPMRGRIPVHATEGRSCLSEGHRAPKRKGGEVR